MTDVSVIPNVEKPMMENVQSSVPEPEPKVAEMVELKAEGEKVDEVVKEEIKVVPMDLQKVALDELKALVREALNAHQFSSPPPLVKVAPEMAGKKVTNTEAAKENVDHVVVVADKVEAATTTEATDSPHVHVAVESEAINPVVVADVEVAATAEAEEKVVLPETATSTELVSVVDDDGAKTVEAIEETVVSVSSIPTEQEPTLNVPSAEPQEERSPEEVSIWGIPLLADERSDTVLLKFLRARDFKPKGALSMLKNTVLWRKEFDIEGLMEENLENPALEKFAFLDGFDKTGSPVCYNVFGVFQDKELYDSTFADAEKRRGFLRWRVQLLEKSIRNVMDFNPGGVCTFVQVNDFKNSPFLLKRELRKATDEALQLLQDNYPEFVAKQVFINVAWWYVAFQTMVNPFLTQRTKSKFVFVGPSKSTETLFKYIAPEQVPITLGGFSKEGEQEFTTAEAVTEEIIKPSTKHTIEFPFPEACNSVWEVRVIGWDVSYGAEFVPSAEDGFTVIVQKLRKITPGEETVIRSSFIIDRPGKIVLTFDNQTSKKKKLLYRSKTKPSAC